MPENPHSSTPRAIGILFASGLLIVFAGLAGLGATAISVAAAPDEGASSQPALHASRNPDRIHDESGYADVSGRIRILKSFASVDTTVGKGEGGSFQSPSRHPVGRASIAAAPLAGFDTDAR